MPGPTIGAIWGTPPSQADKPFVPVLPLDYVAQGAQGATTAVEGFGSAVLQAPADLAGEIANAASDAAISTVRPLVLWGIAATFTFLALQKVAR